MTPGEVFYAEAWAGAPVTRWAALTPEQREAYEAKAVRVIEAGKDAEAARRAKDPNWYCPSCGISLGTGRPKRDSFCSICHHVFSGRGYEP